MMEGVTGIAFDLLSFSAITVLVVMGLGISLVRVVPAVAER